MTNERKFYILYQDSLESSTEASLVTIKTILKQRSKTSGQHFYQDEHFDHDLWYFDMNTNRKLNIYSPGAITVARVET